MEENKKKPNSFGFKPQDSNNDDGKPKKPKFNIYIIYALIFIVIISLQFLYNGKSTEKTVWNEFKVMLSQQDVEKIIVVRNEGIAEIYLKKDRLEHYKEKLGRNVSLGPHFNYSIGSIEGFEQKLTVAQENVIEEERIFAEYEERPNYLGDILNWIFPIILLVVLWLWIFRRMSKGMGGGAGGNIFSVGKSKATLFDKEKHVKVDFKDVAGLEEAKVEIKEIVDFLKNPKKYTDLGGKIPKGALLVGPPGTGKTLLAKAVAGEANVPFFSMSGSDFVEMFVGVGASRVRDLFKQAKEKAPCIIFIDEIDAIGRARGKNPNMGSNDERENTLNQLLTEMDGFGTNTGVIVLAATNRADMLDKALMRAGRFDRQIHVELPDLIERRDIFKVHMRPLKLDSDVDISLLAKQTPGFSGADIANVCNEAALIAARVDKKAVGKQDFFDAVDRIIGGLERKNKIITKEEKKTIAYHEAGHATVSWLLKYSHPLVKVTIIPRGKALGAAWYLPEERQITTMEQMLDEMCSTLGGRAAEDLTFGKVSTGALNDLERVSKQAMAMVAYYGMSKEVGNVSFYDSTGQSEFSFGKPYSEKTAQEIDRVVSNMVEEQYSRALSVLSEHKEGLEELAQILLEKEVLFSDDLVRIFGERKGNTPEKMLAEAERKEALEKAELKDKEESIEFEEEKTKDTSEDNNESTNE